MEICRNAGGDAPASASEAEARRIESERMATVSLRNVKKIYPFVSGENKKKKKRNYMEIMMNDRERIGKKLAEIRSEKGYTVRQLAELADLRPATISNVENGKFSVGIDILTKICNTLGARIEIVKE